MSNSYFAFKQFVVHHDRCAMKVGTDGVLLGAWAPVEGVRRVLDVGTGTGLIALMLAQRSGAQITAIDIDEGAVEQARINVDASDWNSRIEVVEGDFTTLSVAEKFDLIVSNPPFFVDALKCPDKQRNKARHTDMLPFEKLISQSAEMLEENGMFAVVIPADAAPSFITMAKEFSLYVQRCTRVIPTVGAAPKRMLLNFVKQPVEPQEDDLLVELSRHVYSADYVALTKDFYLKM